MTVSSTFKAADGDGYELQMGRWSQRLGGPFLDFVGGVAADSSDPGAARSFLKYLVSPGTGLVMKANALESLAR